MKMKFAETFELLVNGHKTCTSRVPAQKWYDWYKDVNMEPKIVQAEGLADDESTPIKLLSCTVMKLGYVKQNLYWQEGCSSPEAFQNLWESLHKTFNPELLVCVIFFTKTC